MSLELNPQSSKLKLLSFAFLSAFAMCLVCVEPLDAQTNAKNPAQQKQDPQQKSDPLIEPQTDPFAQTQTKSSPAASGMPQQPGSNQRQTQQPGQKPNANQTPKKNSDVVVPKPEELILDTSDGVNLRCSYLAAPTSAETEPQNVVPVILLHDWEGNRNDLAEYAFFLQSEGFAVIIPDLRGHGGSLKVTGIDKPIEFSKFRKSEVMSAQKDIERCKKFLVQRHNLGELNIDLLCVAAVGRTCVLAVQWTLNDWVAFPAFNAKGIKQGQDVKALLLVSPVKKLAGTSLVPNLKHGLFSGGESIPVLVMWGESDEHASESEAIYNLLKKSRPDFSKIEDPEQRKAATNLFSVPVRKYKFTGQEMIQQPKVNNLWSFMTNKLFKQRVVENAKNFPWITREDKDEKADE